MLILSEGKYTCSDTNCYNIEQSRITQCDRSEEAKRNYLSKRRPISPSRIKLKYLAKQQQQQQQQTNNSKEAPRLQDSFEKSYRKQFSNPNDYDYLPASTTTGVQPLSSSKSLEWHVRCDDSTPKTATDECAAQVNRYSLHQPHPSPNLIRGSISKSKSIDYLSSFENQGDRSDTPANRQLFDSAAVSIATISNSYYDDGDSGILVNDSGQCSIMSDVPSVQRDETKTVYLRRGKSEATKSFGLLISQIARTFDSDQNRFRIRHILKNSEADLSGQLQVGDEIISVNDVPAIELSFDEIQEMINGKTVLRLVLQRGRPNIREIR